MATESGGTDLPTPEDNNMDVGSEHALDTRKRELERTSTSTSTGSVWIEERPRKIHATSTNPETRIKSVILNEIMPAYEKEHELSLTVPEKQMMIDFAYETHTKLKKRENSDVSLAIKLDNVFKALSQRIDALETAQKAEIQKGNVQLTAIDVQCKKLVEQTVPSEAEETYSKICARISPTSANDGFQPPAKKVYGATQQINVPVETKNRFAVLEIEDNHKVKTDDEFNGFKKHLSRSLQGKKIRISKVVKTKAGNVSLEFRDDSAKQQAEQILLKDPPMYTKLRPSKTPVPMTHIAIRGVPVELDEAELRNQLRNNNDGFTILKKPEAALKTGGEFVKPRQRTRTWKLSIPRCDDARKIVKQSYLYIDLESLSVELWAPGPRRCTTCFSTEHLANKPTKCNNMICNICADHHPAKDCQKTKSEDQFKCYVCAMLRSNHNHRATVKDCPVLRKEKLDEVKKAAEFLHHV